MASVSENLKPSYREKTSLGLKASRTRHRVTFNRTKRCRGKRYTCLSLS